MKIFAQRLRTQLGYYTIKIRFKNNIFSIYKRILYKIQYAATMVTVRLLTITHIIAYVKIIGKVKTVKISILVTQALA